MPRRRAALQGAPRRVQQVLPVGGEVQLAERAGGLPPHRVREPPAGREAARRRAGRGERGD